MGRWIAWWNLPGDCTGLFFVVVVSDVINTYLIPSGIMLLQLLLLLLLGVDSVLLCSNLVVIFKLTQSLCVADLPQGAVVQVEWFH